MNRDRRRFPGHSNPPPPPPPPVIHKTIKAKALRKKGTDKYYVNSVKYTYTSDKVRQLFYEGDEVRQPLDAELIDITIIIEP